MNPVRVKYLENLLNEQPNDPFPIYGLALEFREEDPKKAIFYFEKGIIEHPTYTPNYYTFAQFLFDFDQNEKALNIAKKGLTIMEQSDTNEKAIHEMQVLIQNIELMS